VEGYHQQMSKVRWCCFLRSLHGLLQTAGQQQTRLGGEAR
jgi:hypothetical protein